MEEYDYYPQKPELIEKKINKGIGKTIFSILLFIMAFSLIGAGDIQFILFLVIVLLVHELGHFTMMKLFKYKDVQMLFVPFMGAFVKGNRENEKQTQSLLVILAGPIPGIVIGLTLLYFGNNSELKWMNDLAFLFLFLNSLNLLPLDPLDGGQLLKILVNNKQERFQLIFTFISSLVLILSGWYFELWLIVIFGFFMGFRVKAIQKNYQIHKELDEQEVNYNTSYKLLSNKDFSFIKNVVVQHTPALRTYIDQIDDGSIDPVIASQVNNVLVNPFQRNASVLYKMFIVVIWIVAFVSPFIAAYFFNYNSFL
jgi:stage IV sporulation protein FB